MSLTDRLKARIAQDGPMRVSDYMEACLHDPDFGYYATRPALGAGGDFITAPLVSQMFGELIGLWCVAVWRGLGAPQRFRLVEIGPGDGTLMSDLLRAARLDPAFLAAADLWLVETAPPLRAAQAKALADAPVSPRWADRLEVVEAGAPLLLVANELLDCLPVRQFIRTERGWAERMVGLDEAGGLAFGLRPAAPPTDMIAERGELFELSPAQAALGGELGARLVRDNGVALLIDYGRDAPGFGDTLQALRRHRKEGPLDHPGEADLTVHADFPAVLAAARAEGAGAGLLSQGEFLRRLGVAERAAALSKARPDRADVIARQLDRLVGDDQMGTLFKAAALWGPGPVPPAFDEEPSP